MKKIVFIICSCLLFLSCEKDDICDPSTPTTPRLTIEFYNNLTAVPTLKNVVDLGIIAPELTKGFGFTGISKISIPLKINADVTVLNFIQNGSNLITTDDNIDIVTFNYARKSIYVSRACGF